MRFNFLKDTKTYCLAPVPLLFIFTNFFAIGAILFLIFLLFFLLIRSLIKKRRGLVVFDSVFKTACLFSITFFVFLIIFGYFYRDHYLYVISFLSMATSLIINLFLGKKFSLFTVRKIYLIFAIIFLVIFIVISFINISEAYNEWREKIKEQQETIEFKKVLSGLPIPPDLITESQDIDSILFYVSRNTSDLKNYYKPALTNAEWIFFEEQKLTDYETGLFYKKIDNKNKWLELSFYEDQPGTTFLRISVYNEKPLPSFPLRFLNPLGPCGGIRWF